MPRNDKEINKQRREVAAASKNEHAMEKAKEEQKLRGSEWARLNPPPQGGVR